MRIPGIPVSDISHDDGVCVWCVCKQTYVWISIIFLLLLLSLLRRSCKWRSKYTLIQYTHALFQGMYRIWFRLCIEDDLRACVCMTEWSILIVLCPWTRYIVYFFRLKCSWNDKKLMINKHSQNEVYRANHINRIIRLTHHFHLINDIYAFYISRFLFILLI